MSVSGFEKIAALAEAFYNDTYEEPLESPGAEDAAEAAEQESYRLSLHQIMSTHYGGWRKRLHTTTGASHKGSGGSGGGSSCAHSGGHAVAGSPLADSDSLAASAALSQLIRRTAETSVRRPLGGSMSSRAATAALLGNSQSLGGASGTANSYSFLSLGAGVAGTTTAQGMSPQGDAAFESACDVAQTAFRAASASQGIDLRFMHSGAWEQVADHVLDGLSASGTREAVTFAQYEAFIVSFREWCHEHQHNLPVLGNIQTERALVDASTTPDLSRQLFLSCPSADDDGDLASPPELHIGDAAHRSTGPTTGGDGDRDDLAALATTIRTVSARKVAVSLLHMRLWRQILEFKVEAELRSCDADNDGLLAEAEIENYVRALLPNTQSLRGIAPEMVAPYVTGAVRRIMWTLDPSDRGTVPIARLLRHPVLADWVEVQLRSEEQLGNWFSTAVASQLHDKFVALDRRGVGRLSLPDMLRFKKGIPMVVDDGLPEDISPICTLFLDRVFETAPFVHKGEMDYGAFVDFVVAIEFLPTCDRPHFLWNALDITGQGVLTPVIAHAFFKETHEKLTSAGVGTAAVEIILQELFDLVPTKEPLRITKAEFMAANQSGLLTALLIDCLAFYVYENREQK